MTDAEVAEAEPAKTYPNPTLREFFTVTLSLALFNQYGGTEDLRPELVDAWVTMATLENSTAAWNPSDTTYGESGATPFNSFGPGGRYHVWNYQSAEQGISAFLKTIGMPEYSPLRRAMLDPTTPLANLLAAIATSPWTGIANDPGLYDGVEPDYERVVPGDGGWSYAPKVVDPPGAEPEPAPEPKPETEAEKVESAIDAQVADVRTDEEQKPVDKEAVKSKVAEIETHLAELKDLLG